MSDSNLTDKATDIEAACADFVPTWLARMCEQAEAVIGPEAKVLTDSDWQLFFGLPQFSIIQAGELLAEACRAMCAVAKPEIERLRAENERLKSSGYRALVVDTLHQYTEAENERLRSTIDALHGAACEAEFGLAELHRVIENVCNGNRELVKQILFRRSKIIRLESENAELERLRTENAQQAELLVGVLRSLPQ